MRVYVNKRKKLILAPEVFEKYGGVSNETMQIKDGEFTKEIEKEVNEAMQEIINRWQPIFDDNLDSDCYNCSHYTDNLVYLDIFFGSD